MGVFDDTQIYVCDSVMGSGKSSAAINYIRETNDKILYITPYLDEVERIRTSCANREFIAPEVVDGATKLSNLKKLLSEGRNIVSTHALFERIDDEVISLCKRNNYTLIMDEVSQVVQEYKSLWDNDRDLFLSHCVEKDKRTGMLSWKSDFLSEERDEDYKGVFWELKQLCDHGSLYNVSGNNLLWVMSPSIFTAFSKIIVLTYLFEGQVMRCYFEYFNIDYKYIGVENNDEHGYGFSFTPNKDVGVANYKKLIKIASGQKLNEIGSKKYDLSKAWFERNAGGELGNNLRNNIYNFFNNIANFGYSPSGNNLWTCFKDYKKYIKGKGYTKGFIPLNSRATNAYGNRTAVAYPVNIFFNTSFKIFFAKKGIKTDEDTYALSEMLQFVWRAAIRNNKQIDLYVPSKRMRTLLRKWVATHSVK